MTGEQRREHILNLVAAGNAVSVSELARHWRVSEMTIRRDLAALAEAGLIARTHGGAIGVRKSALEFKFQDREERCSAEKRAIAEFMARQVREGMTISLDTGTTTLAVARALGPVKGLTILTTSLAVAWTLAAQDNVEVVLSGGTMRRTTPDLSGPVAEENIRRFHVNLAVVGADAVSRAGAFTNETGVAGITRALMETADRVALVVDHTKFSAVGFVRYASLSDFDTIVTDEGCPPDVRAWLGKCRAEVVFVPVRKCR